MGATTHFETGIKLTNSQDKIRASFNRRIENATVEYGTDPYSGTIGTLTGIVFEPNKVHESADKAEEYIDNKAEKWDNAIAVKYKGSDGQVYWAIGALLAE